MRRLWSLVILLLLLSFNSPVLAEPIPDLPVRAFVLMDAGTAQILYEQEGRTRLPIASTTKMMTAILALERGDLGAIVRVGRKPYETGGTTIYLEVGEEQTLMNLLYALMLESANDAAVAIAEHLAGTEEQFVDWMNEKARSLGATQTHFVNSHGLYEPDHYSTAYDLALIARYAMQNRQFREVVSTVEREIPGAGSGPARSLYNLNRLLGYYDGANGIKNGFTEEAGLTLVSSAQRGDRELIAVVLGAENRLWTTSMALLDLGFGSDFTQEEVRADAPLPPVEPTGAESLGPASAPVANARAGEAPRVIDIGRMLLTSVLLVCAAMGAALGLNRVRWLLASRIARL